MTDIHVMSDLVLIFAPLYNEDFVSHCESCFESCKSQFMFEKSCLSDK